MTNFWVALAAVLGGLGVALGAFGTHALQLWLPLQKVTIFETAVRYHMFHALSLLGVAVLMGVYPALGWRLRRAAIAFAVGILLFSGGLYGMALSDLLLFRWVVPLGGVAFVLGWGLLAHAFLARTDGPKRRPNG